MKIEDPVERNENPDAVERFYRENYGAIRAPETLREETLRKMLAKQKKLEAGEAPSAETEKRAGKIVTLFGARRSVTRFAAAAAALVLILAGSVFAFGRGGRLPSIYADGLASDYAAVFRAAGEVRVMPSDAGPLPFAFSETLGDFRLSESAFYSVTDANANALDSVARFRYEQGDKTFTVVLSENQTLAPAALYSVTPRTIAGIPVYLGKSDADGSVYAAWSSDGYMAAACLENGTERSFVKLLETLLDADGTS